MSNLITQKIGTQKIFRSRSTGRFAKSPTVNRARTRATRTPARASTEIKNGALYSYRGQTVRALAICNNGLRLVGSHNSLFGFARDTDLKKIDSNRINNYLTRV